MKNKSRRMLTIIIGMLLMVVLVVACRKKTSDSKKSITLTMWHVYEEQADSPMNRLIQEFNDTAGKEKGIIINVTLMSNASQIGEKLLAARDNKPGVPDMPDLFFCHNNNAEELGSELLLNWKEVFSQEDLDNYVQGFIEDGLVGDKLVVFPVSKSTHMLFVAGGRYDRFSKETGVTYEMLESWKGFFEVCERYYEWSGGKAFCVLDYPIRCVELYAMAMGAGDIYKNGWYDINNELFKQAYLTFAEAIAKGHIALSDQYSNTQVMTGEVMAGLGSSASILYYNDTITYPDNTTEPMWLKVIPMPRVEGKDYLVTQAGVGLCAYDTTKEKREAAAIFASWLTDKTRNLDFVTQTGYMPVRKEAFEELENYQFDNEGYRNLYKALGKVQSEGTLVREPSFEGYYNKVYGLYDGIKAVQEDMAERSKAGEDPKIMAMELWDLLVRQSKQ